MKRSMPLLLALALCSAVAGPSSADTPKKPEKPKPDAVLALADRYINAREPGLKDKDKATIGSIRAALKKSSFSPIFLKDAVSDLVNQMTVALAGMKSLDALIVGSAYLVKCAPANPRTSNLFGAVLHAGSEPAGSTKPGAGPPLAEVRGGTLLADATVVLEYTHKLSPDSTLALVNLANVYFDYDRDNDAKALLDRAVFLDANCRPAHRGLALYWFRRQDYNHFREELLKAAQFKGFVRGKKEKHKGKTDEEAVAPGESLPAMEAKLDKLKDSVPLNTADIVEDEFPEPARQIREEYGKLRVVERMEMPKLPQVNTNSNQDYLRNRPVIEQWVKSSGERLRRFGAAVVGIDVTASKAKQKAQTAAAGKDVMKDNLEAGRRAAEAMRNMPGLTAAQRAKLEEGIRKLNQTAQKRGVKLSDTPPSEDMAGAFGQDTGGLFSDSNYYAYQRISNSYLLYFKKFWKDYDANVTDIARVYQAKVKEEDDYHDQRMAVLGQEHNQDGNPHGNQDVPCKAEQLRHKKKLNEIGDDYYKQWVNVYMPAYTKKMKPIVENYWATCALYVKNLNDPKVAKREYQKLAGVYLMNAGRAISYIQMGEEFKWHGSTDEEEEALRQAMKAAEEEAKAKRPEFEQATRVPERGWTDWVAEHLVLEVSGEFLSFKLTARTIEFEAWLFGPTGRVKLDVVDGTMETFSGVSAKFHVGIDVCGLKGKVEAKTDLGGRYSKWDFENNKFSEGWQPPGSGEAKIELGPASVTGEVAIDPELNAKVATKGAFLGSENLNFTVQQETPM
jgi:hypothetical protein